VYLGSNLNFNALLPKVVQRGYDALVRLLGSAIATRVAVVGSLISDRGWIPTHPQLADRRVALKLFVDGLEKLSKRHKAKLALLKDIHQDFPPQDLECLKQLGFAVGFSLPTIRINTDYPSFEDYLQQHLSKNGRRHARKQFNKAQGLYNVHVLTDFEHMIPRVFPLHRAVFLKAQYQFEELTPNFFRECARSQNPKTELVVCERSDGRIVGSLLIIYDEHEQQNKRVGIDYEIADSGLIYNILNYTGIQRAIERRIPTLWLGQSSYTPKTRLGGELDDQYVLMKAYDPLLKPTLPLQCAWMRRYSKQVVLNGLEQAATT
jgi:hypothetical protein